MSVISLLTMDIFLTLRGTLQELNLNHLNHVLSLKFGVGGWPGGQITLSFFLEDDENQTIANFCHTQCFIIADSSVT